MPPRRHAAVLLATLAVQPACASRIKASSMVVLEQGQQSRGTSRTSGESCAPLKNEGSFSSVEVFVGTPPQKFNVVADTGSDSLIVRSCMCEVLGHCKYGSRCFNGLTSSTFRQQAAYTRMEITFGSGPVDAAVTTDVARVGEVSATMADSLFVMTDEDVGMELEGILGLGLPPTKARLQEMQPRLTATGQWLAGSPILGEGLLALANMSRFSMCFNTGDQDGTLRMGSKVRMDAPLGTIGKHHWSVEFRGITVGASPLQGKSDGPAPAGHRLAFCGDRTRRDGQETPCGALPDSGTTLITAPAAHLHELFQQLCDSWPACRQRHVVKTAERLEAELKKALGLDRAASAVDEQVKVATFLDQLATCDLDGLPPLRFHLRGADGSEQAIELQPNDYVMETSVERSFVLRKGLGNLSYVEHEMPKPKGEGATVCVPAFSADDFTTADNGPVWIFGSPFFYRYTISYDRQALPPAVSFDTTPCTPCRKPGQATSLVQQRSRERIFLSKDALLSRFNASRGL